MKSRTEEIEELARYALAALRDLKANWPWQETNAEETLAALAEIFPEDKEVTQ